MRRIRAFLADVWGAVRNQPRGEYTWFERYLACFIVLYPFLFLIAVIIAAGIRGETSRG